MQTQTRISLKPDKDRPIRQRHHWIFSGAVQELPEFSDGEAAEVFASNGERLGIALLNKGKSLIGQMISFGSETVTEALKNRIREAAELRRRLFDPKVTNAFRLINTEGDGIPGLIVDSYNGALVIQASTPGIELLKDQIINLLIEELGPKAIFEKSTSALRKREGLTEQKGHLYGDPNPEIEVLENGLKFSVHVLEGQKTGLFLDQRDMRAQIREFSQNKRVLNCFSYTGGFSIAALAGGAQSAVSVDISAKCGAAIEKNLALNAISSDIHRFIACDAIDFVIQKPLDYDLIILDPPAFAKKRADVPKASHAYRKLNRKVIEKMAPGSLLFTCSCSSQIDEKLFQTILFKASLEAGRRVRIIGRHRQAPDHPISIYHPESYYLKALVLEVL